MGAIKKLKEIAKAAVGEAVSSLNDDEKKLILVWSQNALTIRNNRSLTKKEKITRIQTLATPKVVKVIGIRIFEACKNKLWTNQSWARRLGIVGLGIGGFTFGGTGVGIATLGAGIGLPLLVLTAGGGVILGAVIDEVSKEL